MPLTSGKGAGAVAAANASLNHVGTTGDLTAGAVALIGDLLQMPALNHLTYVVVQTAGVDSILVQPEVAFRRAQVLGPAGLVWVSIGPQMLTPIGGAPLVIHVNTVAVQAMRMTFTHNGADGAPVVSATYFLSASG